MPNLEKKEREKLKSELDAIELDITEKIEQLNPEELFAGASELPSLSNSGAEELDYKKQIDDIQAGSTKIVDNLAELYLGDEQLLAHPYIVEKRKKDAEYYGKLDFLVSTSEKTLVNVMREIDGGNSSSKLIEVQSMLQKEMRENIKLSLKSLSDIESFYKSIREDIGVSAPISTLKLEEATEETNHVDMKDFNQQLDDMMNNKEGAFDFDDDDDDDD